MRKKIRITIIIIATLTLVYIAYQLLLGKLFPYSPIHLGFEEYELAHSIVYIQNGTTFTDLERIDSLISPVEKFHRLTFLQKPEFFIFCEKEDYLQRSISRARFCAFYNGNIVIAPWAIEEDKEGKISLEIYLTHELSHSILFQNKGLFSAYRYPKWLLEGIAVYSSNQMGTSFYPSKEETYALIKKGNFFPPEYFETDKEEKIKIDLKNKQAFIYSEFACIVDYIIIKYGQDTFIQYIKALIEEDDNEIIFRKIFNKDIDEVILEFKQAVLES